MKACKSTGSIRNFFPIFTGLSCLDQMRERTAQTVADSNLAAAGISTRWGSIGFVAGKAGAAIPEFTEVFFIGYTNTQQISVSVQYPEGDLRGRNFPTHRWLARRL